MSRAGGGRGLLPRRVHVDSRTQVGILGHGLGVWFVGFSPGLARVFRLLFERAARLEIVSSLGQPDILGTGSGIPGL